MQDTGNSSHKWTTLGSCCNVKEFQRLLPTYFRGFAAYPSRARQAITDIAYQYGPSGAANRAADGKIKAAAEVANWKAAGALCAELTYASATRNAHRKELFDSAAAIVKAPLPK